jgi:hypothetical protein
LPDFEKVMGRDSEPARSHTNKVTWDLGAFVQYALVVIGAIVKERKKAENMRKRTSAQE